MFCWWDHHHFSSAHSAGIILRRRVSFWIPAAGHLAKNDDGRTSKTFLVQNNHKTEDGIFLIHYRKFCTHTYEKGKTKEGLNLYYQVIPTVKGSSYDRMSSFYQYPKGFQNQFKDKKKNSL